MSDLRDMASTKPTLADSVNFQTVNSPDGFQDDDSYSEQPKPLHKNPYLKVAIALGGVFFLIGFGSLFVIVGSGDPESGANTAQTGGEVEPLTLSLDPPSQDLASGAQSAQELDRLRAENALLSQQLALAQVERNARPPTVEPEGTPSPTPEVVATPPPARPTVQARAVPTTAVRPAPPPARSVQPSRPAPPRLSTTPRIPMPSPEPVDPNEIWNQLSTTGMYGVAPAFTSVSQETPETSPMPVEAPSAIAFSGVPGLISPSEQRKIPMGQRIAATVSAPIAWIDSDAQYRVELSAPILFEDEQIAIPEGAHLIVQVGDLNTSNGLAQLIVTGFQIDEDFTPLPSEFFLVNGADGNPLIAFRFGDPGSQIASSDIELFAIGALAEVGRVINRPDSQTITTGTFGSTVSTQNGDENLFAAVLEGGSEEISDRLGDRNDDRIDELLGRDAIFYLKEGQELEIYIDGDFSL